MIPFIRFAPIVTILLLASVAALAQTGVQNLKNIQPESAFDNVFVKALDEDSLASTFLIWVKKSVQAHYHANHTEVIYVVEGRGTMQLGEQTLQLKPGDYVMIPAGTAHSVVVSGSVPLKVLSTQTPYFDGADRHFLPRE